MLGYFRNNLSYRIISILAAVLIWFFVFSERNPTTDDLVNVPLEVTGLPTDLVIAEKPNTVSIRFQGKSNVVDKISSRDFRAYISLEDANVGVRSVQVFTEIPPGVRLVSVQPAWVQIEIDQVSSIQLPVEIDIIGDVANGFNMELPRLYPGEVLVKGPENHLEKINRVFVSASLNKDSVDYYNTLPVLVEDNTGTLIMEWVEVIPRTIDVLIPIVEDIPNRTVPIVMEIMGELPDGLKLDKVYVYPSTIIIYGSREVINKINYLTVPIDISEITESTELEITPELPEGIERVSKETIQVIVEVVNENKDL
jgi:YbbR domain-containing protein